MIRNNSVKESLRCCISTLRYSLYAAVLLFSGNVMASVNSATGTILIEKIIKDKTEQNKYAKFQFNSDFDGTFWLGDHWVHNTDDGAPLAVEPGGTEFTVEEAAIPGWRLAAENGIYCESLLGANSFWTYDHNKVKITLFPYEVVECTYTNEEHFCGDGTKDEGEECDDGNNENGDGCNETCEIECVDAIQDCAPADECQEAVCVSVGEGGGAICDYQNANEGGECTADDNLCTNEVCRSGECVSEEIVLDCPASDECHGEGQCDPATGECTNPTANEGLACAADDNLCTNEVCRDGSCVSEEKEIDCSDAPECHANGRCDPSTGACAYDALSGTSCSDDKDACTTDICVEGQCAHEQLPQCCGNGVREGTEICDDGNLDNGDGCDANCNFEGAIKIRKVFEGEHDPFEFDPSWLGEDGNFSLGNGDIWFSHFLTAGGPYTVTELPATGWDVSDIQCECFESDIQGEAISSMECTSEPVIDVDNNHVSITVAGAELVICTFFNVEVPEECGDGVLQEGEACDPAIAEGDEGYVAGCRADCTYCGDGVKNGEEECDFNDPTNEGVPEGQHCHETCTVCPPEEKFCGDGSLTPPETCDPAIKSGVGHADNCRTEGDAKCTFCGDHIVNGGEACDGTPGCSATCEQLPPPPECGDGNVDDGEQCDKGEANSNEPNAECRTDCTLPRCGDGIVDDGEACDGTPHCSETCDLLPYCGDGEVNGDEECDGGPHCEECKLVPYCGDGEVNGDEECDLGDLNGTEGALCDAECKTIEQETGCTLTQGYWKTHSRDGSASKKRDATWDLLANAEDTPFYPNTCSDGSYYDVISNPGGSDYNNLAVQFIAAQLNVLAGASMPANVQAAYDAALAYFQAYDSCDNQPVPAGAHDLLGDYNEGTVGPGHCDDKEDLSSGSSPKKKSSSTTTTTTVTTQGSNSASSNTNANAGLASTNVGTSAGGGCSSTGSGIAGHMPTMALLMVSLLAMRMRRTVRAKVRK